MEKLEIYYGKETKVKKKIKRLLQICLFIGILSYLQVNYPIYAKVKASIAETSKGFGDDKQQELPDRMDITIPGGTVHFQKELSEEAYKTVIQFESPPVFDYSNSKTYTYDEQKQQLVLDKNPWKPGNKVYFQMSLFGDNDNLSDEENWKNIFLFGDPLFYPYEQNSFLKDPLTSNRELVIDYDSGQQQVDSVSFVIAGAKDEILQPYIKVKLKTDPSLFYDKLIFHARFTANEDAPTSFGNQIAELLNAPYSALSEGLTAQYAPMFLYYMEQQTEDKTLQNTLGSEAFQKLVMNGGFYLQKGTTISYLVQLGDDSVKTDSKIAIQTIMMDQDYDGKAVAQPHITVTGSTSSPIFKWYQNIGTEENEKWKLLNEAPVNAGHYKVAVSVAEDTKYTAAHAEKSFTIAKAMPPSPTVKISKQTVNSISITSLDNTETYGGVEYSLNGRDWSKENVIHNLSANTKYTIYARYEGNDNYNPSNSITTSAITKSATYTITIPATTLTAGDNNSNSTISVNTGSPFDLGYNGHIDVNILKNDNVTEQGKLKLTRESDGKSIITSALLVNGKPFTDITKNIAIFKSKDDIGVNVSFGKPTETKILAGTYNGTITFGISYNEN